MLNKLLILQVMILKGISTAFTALASCKKLSDGVLAWIPVWRKVHILPLPLHHLQCFVAVRLNTAKDHKGPTKDPQKEHYGLSCRKLAPIELNGALYSSVRQDFSHAAGLS